jgi:hypothetical protein
MTAIQRQIQSFEWAVCIWDLKTCAAVGQIPRNAINRRGFPKQHLCSLEHTRTGEFAALLRINLLKCAIKLPGKNWRPLNLNHYTTGGLERIPLINTTAGRQRLAKAND